MKWLMIALLVCLPGWSAAQPYPSPARVTVNDLANVLTSDAEARLVTALQTLRAETGIEATVLTLPTRFAYDPSPSIEAFAQGLFNAWGIGDPIRNDGILILVVVGDRELRIELGAGYNPEYDIRAQDIMQALMLPALREDRVTEAIEVGTAAVIEHIARRKAAGEPPSPLPSNRFDLGRLVALLIAAGFLVMIVRSKRAGWRAKRRACPNCGASGLIVQEQAVGAENADKESPRERICSCPACQWREITMVAPATQHSQQERDTFGGGSSSGGGATGRW
jgi:uncharacterized protein